MVPFTFYLKYHNFIPRYLLPIYSITALNMKKQSMMQADVDIVFISNLYGIGRAMAQAVSRRSLTAEAWVRSRLSACGICGGQSGTRTGFSPSTSVFSCQFLSTGAPLKRKSRKTSSSSSQVCRISLQGCGVSVASAAGPFNKKNLYDVFLQ
jgi:hypothetical protein